jgi:hypothetical protein
MSPAKRRLFAQESSPHAHRYSPAGSLDRTFQEMDASGGSKRTKLNFM